MHGYSGCVHLSTVQGNKARLKLYSGLEVCVQVVGRNQRRKIIFTEWAREFHLKSTTGGFAYRGRPNYFGKDNILTLGGGGGGGGGRPGT